MLLRSSAPSLRWSAGSTPEWPQALARDRVSSRCWSSSGWPFAAFSATADNPTSNWNTGTVVLTDDDSNTAMFSATGLKPGSTAAKCIEVTYSGSVATAVRLYATGSTATEDLGSYVDLVVEHVRRQCAKGLRHRHGSHHLCSQLTQLFADPR